jgi:hypothetical protein
MKLILLTLLVFFFSPADAVLNKMLCEGDIHEFKTYIRILSDSVETEDVDFKASCSFPSLATLLNNKKTYVLQLGMRMTDTFKHDDTENDYLMIDVGPSQVKVTPDKITTSYPSSTMDCDAQVFESEQSKTFTHENIFYLRIVFQQKVMSVLFAEKNQKKWTVCTRADIPSISPRKIEFEAFSEFGINLDIVTMDVDPPKAPWSSKENLEKIQSTEHHLEHKQQMDKLYKNVTKKEFSRLGTSVRRLWYCQIIFAVVIAGIVFKYKRDTSRKMHLL